MVRALDSNSLLSESMTLCVCVFAFVYKDCGI